MRVVVNPNEKKDITFSEERLDNLRVNLGLSSNKMKSIANFLRSNVGRKSVPVDYKKHMSEKSKLLQDIYKKDKYFFDCDDAKKEERPVVYANAEELFDAVIMERKLEGNVCVKAMADGGRGFFKISLSIFQENSDGDDFNYDDLTIHDKNQRSLYSEGGSASKKAKLMSVKRVILLCIVPKIKETYENVKLLFDITKINNIPFKFVSDFKLMLIINGQQTASAMFPCPYCFVSLNDLKENKTSGQEDVLYNQCSSNADNFESNVIKLKSYGDLRNDYEQFNLAGGNKKNSKEFHSTINLPLFTESDDITVLEKCVIPELHVLMGFVNHLFWKGLVPLLGKDKALIWPKKLKLISKNYHGDCFEGNACRKLLKEAHKLNDPEIYETVGYLKIIPFTNAFVIMNKVVDCSFTSGKVGPELNVHLDKLNKALIALHEIEDISVTLKIHVLKTHIMECLQFIKHNDGLGYWSEQSGESLHREFSQTWERYKINTIEDELYLEKLFTAVVEFSSLNA